MLSHNSVTSDDVRNKSDQDDSFQSFLRIRPLLPGEDEQAQDYLQIVDEKTLTLSQLKTIDSNMAHEENLLHTFKFTKILNGEVPQQEFFYKSMQNTLHNFLCGQTCLILSCGSRNSGKTYTIQGNRNDPGLVSRIMDTLFNSIGDRIVKRASLKPSDFGQVHKLTQDELESEALLKQKLLGWQKDEVRSDCSKERLLDQGDLDNEERMDELKDSFEEAFTNVDDRFKETLKLETDLKNSAFSLWVSFVELYNEDVFDLLEDVPVGKKRTRRRLVLIHDEDGMAHLQGVTKVPISTADEAIRILLIGQRNLRSAVNLMNCSYDGGHYLFCVEVVRSTEEDDPHLAVVNRLILCDLANPETPSLNLSWLSLRRCINALRENVLEKNRGLKPRNIPVGDSKLTKLVAKAFSKNGLVTVVANASPIASMSDETIPVLNFAAVSAEVANEFISNEQKWMDTNLNPLSPIESNNFQLHLSNLADCIPNSVAEEEILPHSLPAYDLLLKVITMLNSKIHDLEKRMEMKEAQLETRLRQEIVSDIRCPPHNNTLDIPDECSDVIVKNEEKIEDQHNTTQKLNSSLEDEPERATSLTVENKFLNVEVHNLKENLQKLSRSLAECRLENAKLQHELDSQDGSGPSKDELQKMNSSLITLLLRYNLQFENMRRQIDLLEKEVHLRQLLIEHREKELLNSTSAGAIEKRDYCNKSSQTMTDDKQSSVCVDSTQHFPQTQANIHSEDGTQIENKIASNSGLNDKKNDYETQKSLIKDGINPSDLSKKIKYTLTVKCERLNITNLDSCIKLNALPQFSRQLGSQVNKTLQLQPSDHPKSVKRLKLTPLEMDKDLQTHLPSGWFKKIIPRTSGKTSGRKDIYYISPEGKKFRSTKQLKSYLYSRASHR